MKTVYVAQAYGGLEKNERKAWDVIGELNTKFPHICFVSPVLGFGDCYSTLDYDTGMAMCLELLNRCDEILMLDGWENSRGGRLEFRKAMEKRMPILFEDEYLGE